MLITKGDFKTALAKFDKIEPTRGKLYYNARKLVESGFVLEGHVLILATWNTGAFRYVLRRFPLAKYEQLIRTIRQKFSVLEKSDFLKVRFPTYRSRIIESFNRLNEMKGVGIAGASKALHLINPKVFVLWDNYISGNKMRREFERLPVVKSGFWPSVKFERNGRGYYKFLLTCQEKFGHLIPTDFHKTHAKQIDEFNFVNITYRLQQIERKKQKAKKVRLKSAK
jgi:hypothetical protein